MGMDHPCQGAKRDLHRPCVSLCALRRKKNRRYSSERPTNSRRQTSVRPTNSRRCSHSCWMALNGSKGCTSRRHWSWRPCCTPDH
jgi:hypothetical protein